MASVVDVQLVVAVEPSVAATLDVPRPRQQMSSTPR